MSTINLKRAGELIAEMFDTRLPALTAARRALETETADTKLSGALRKFETAVHRWHAAPVPTNTEAVTTAARDAADEIEITPRAERERETVLAAICRFDELTHVARMLRVFHIDAMRFILGR